MCLSTQLRWQSLWKFLVWVYSIMDDLCIAHSINLMVIVSIPVTYKMILFHGPRTGCYHALPNVVLGMQYNSKRLLSLSHPLIRAQIH